MHSKPTLHNVTHVCWRKNVYCQHGEEVQLGTSKRMSSLLPITLHAILQGSVLGNDLEITDTSSWNRANTLQYLARIHEKESRPQPVTHIHTHLHTHLHVPHPNNAAASLNRPQIHTNLSPKTPNKLNHLVLCGTRCKHMKLSR